MTNRGNRTFAGKGKSQPADQSVITIGLLAQRPAAGFPGRLYMASDQSNLVYADNGYTWQALPTGRMVAHSETQVTQGSSTAEFDLVNATVPAGTVTAGDQLRLTAIGGWYNNTGAGTTARLRAYLDGTLIGDTGVTLSLITGGVWRPWRAELNLYATTLTTTWAAGFYHGLSQSPASETTWATDATTVTLSPRNFGNFSTPYTANWANAIVIRLTGTLSGGTGADSQACNGYSLERLIH